MKRFTIYRAEKRYAVLDNSSNIIALLSLVESDRFDSTYAMLEHMKRRGCEGFFDAKMDELCSVFMGEAA